MSANIHEAGTPDHHAAQRRWGVLAYAVAAYAAGMAALAWLVAVAAGLCPLRAGPLHVASTDAAIAFNIALLTLFGLQHSVMARRHFKAWWTRVIPRAAERSTYVLVSGLTLGAAIWLWQPLPGIVWSVDSPAGRIALWTLFALGWLYLVAATFATNHFDLFGLRQAWFAFRGKRYAPVAFVTHWMYRYSRHPMMTGILVGLWATPEMSMNHLVLAAGLSAYIAVGVWHEEQDLRHQFGWRYERYAREVGALFPRVGLGRSRSGTVPQQS